MKWLIWAAVVASAGALTACSGGDSTGAGGTGGEGGDPTTGPGPTSSSTGMTGSGSGGATSSSVTGSGGMGGGGSACDQIGVCQDPMNPMTMTCSTCAQQGDCADELAACMASPECVALNMCFQACMAGDQMCLNTCVMMNMAGYQVYNAINLCVVCDNCPTSCAALAMQLMCP